MAETKPTIIKRKKVAGGDGHHGGAWKVAYADFVTAMMAFFLLMWLLNATTESQRKGLADYFAPAVPISPVTGGGDGLLMGDSVFAEDTLAQSGTGGTETHTTQNRQSVGDTGHDPIITQAPEETFSELENRLKGRTGESEAEDELLSHVRTRVTDEGLVIEIFAKEGRPLFLGPTDRLSPKMTALLDMVGNVMSLVANRVAVTGHTARAEFDYEGADDWRLSAARADRARRHLMRAGIDDARFVRVTGKADRQPALPETPADPRNGRITLTLLRSSPSAGPSADRRE